MPLRSEVSFGSFLVYSPRGTTEPSRKSKTFVVQLKTDRVLVWMGRNGVRSASAAEYAVERMLEERDAGRLGDLAELFGPEVVLVPVPRSVMSKPGALWPSREIAKALVRAGFGARVETWLRRRTAVTKSASAPLSERPSARQHYDTIDVDARLEHPTRVVLVDDVITRGATQLAAASRIAEAYTRSDVRAFAVVRTQSEGEIESMLAPVVGTITLRANGGTKREP